MAYTSWKYSSVCVPLLPVLLYLMDSRQGFSGAFTIWMEFSVAFSVWTNGTVLFSTKETKIDWTVSFVRMPVGRGLGTYHVNKKHGGWTSYRARRFIGWDEKLGFFTRRRQFLPLAAAASTFSPKNQHPHFSYDVAQAEARWNAESSEVKEKHKYRPQNVIRFYLLGYSCVSNVCQHYRRTKTHCSDKRFGNLPPSFRSLAFFLGSITVKSLAL